MPTRTPDSSIGWYSTGLHRPLLEAFRPSLNESHCGEDDLPEHPQALGQEPPNSYQMAPTHRARLRSTAPCSPSQTT
eukprot:3000245-Pleurochrysis_carterae.AAC.1